MYKLLDYDITEYKQLENTLNELSKQGYNPTSLGKISRFEKNEIINVLYLKKDKKQLMNT